MTEIDSRGSQLPLFEGVVCKQRLVGFSVATNAESAEKKDLANFRLVCKTWKGAATKTFTIQPQLIRWLSLIGRNRSLCNHSCHDISDHNWKVGILTIAHSFASQTSITSSSPTHSYSSSLPSPTSDTTKKHCSVAAVPSITTLFAKHLRIAPLANSRTFR